MATNVDVNTGTTIGLSATLPASYTSLAYNALTFIDIAEVVDIGEIAKAFTVINHQPVGRAYPDKLKDVYDIGNVTLTLGRFSTDTGQIALQTALAASAAYAFEVVLPSGDTAFFEAKVIKAGIGAIASGAVSTTTVELAVTPNSLFEE